MTDFCPPVDDLKLFSVGRMSYEDLERIATHLAACVACENRLDELHRTSEASTDDLIAALRAPTDAEPFSQEDCREIVASITDLVARRIDGQRRETEPVAGTLIGGCRLEEPLAYGSFGTVYRAVDLDSSELRAVKVLSQFRFSDARIAARFDREAELLLALEHPNIVKVFRGGRQDGMPFLVMELIDGVSLSALMRFVGTVDLPEACQLVCQAALALQFASAKSVIHRDIKPSNIMLTSTGEVRVLDFGLAVMTLDVPLSERLTASGQVLGTPDYIAPEQIKDSRQADVRSDLYSLGCVFYELLSGKPPFRDQRSTLGKLRAHRQDPPVPIEIAASSIPAEIATLIGKLLEKDPGDRPPTPDEIISVLQPWPAKSDLLALVQRCRKPAAGS